jgi:prepilin-type N-terminal cleavage/methylation domain-containing protein
MGKKGFSLIEILISTAILLVIVVMVSMVFQQQSAAFQSGTDRVKGQASLRNAMGMIVRDLSLAVTNSYGISDSDIKFTT